jgi:bifunctional protein pyrR
VGKNVPPSRSENIQVRTKQFDQCYEVALLSK